MLSFIKNSILFNQQKQFEFACRKGLLFVVKKLINKKSVNPVKNNNLIISEILTNKYKLDPITSSEIVKLLIKDERVDPTRHKNWAIRVASLNGLFNIVKILLEDKRVNPFDADNEAIIYADKYGHTNIVKLLWNDERVKLSLKEDYIELFEKLNKEYLKDKIKEF